MVIDSLVNSYDLYRPSKASGYDGKVTYTKATLFNVKLSQPSRGWTIDTAGSVRSETATLFFNPTHSTMSNALVPPFKVGDIICNVGNSTEPLPDRFTVQSVTEHTFRGVLHHFEVVLV